MASKAFALLLIARAARSAAAAGSRFARLAELRALSSEAVAATSHAPRLSSGGHTAAKPAPAMAAVPRAVDVPSPRTGSSGPSWKDICKPSDTVSFEAKDEDLESDEAMWALYERWCKFFNQKREPDEMVRRFKIFKNSVLHVHRKPGLRISKFADRQLREMRTNHHAYDPLYAKFENSSFYSRGDGRYLREVFADYNVVNGKLFLVFPVEKGARIGYTKEVSVDYEVVSGKLFADLPASHELVVPNMEFMMRRRW